MRWKWMVDTAKKKKNFQKNITLGFFEIIRSKISSINQNGFNNPDNMIK